MHACAAARKEPQGGGTARRFTRLVWTRHAGNRSRACMERGQHCGRAALASCICRRMVCLQACCRLYGPAAACLPGGQFAPLRGVYSRLFRALLRSWVEGSRCVASVQAAWVTWAAPHLGWLYKQLRGLWRFSIAHRGYNETVPEEGGGDIHDGCAAGETMMPQRTRPGVSVLRCPTVGTCICGQKSGTMKACRKMTAAVSAAAVRRGKRCQRSERDRAHGDPAVYLQMLYP